MIAQISEITSPTVGDFDERDRAQSEFESHLAHLSDCIIADGRGSGRKPAELLDQYGRIVDRDQFMPSLEEMNIVYSRVGGKVYPNPYNSNRYYMEMPGKTITGTREAIWNWYWDRREMMELVAAARPLPF
jgi:hypothetical protein